jgi:hypothetical protein
MNMFKSLDTIYPCGDENRPYGEVVHTIIRVFLDGVELGELSMKRKAWYVNASVNAFHMHRGLVRELTDIVRGTYLDGQKLKRVKRLVVLAVLNSYLVGRETDAQVFPYLISARLSPEGEFLASLTWETGGLRATPLRTILDLPDRPLRELVEGSVEDFSLIGKAW